MEGEGLDEEISIAAPVWMELVQRWAPLKHSASGVRRLLKGQIHPLPIFAKKVYWNTALPIGLQIVFGYFHAK